MREHGIAAYFIPNNDEFSNEYLPDSAKRIEFLTGFTGSAATLVVGLKKAAFFTDGRYTIQATTQVNSSIFEIYNIKDLQPTAWLEREGLQAAYDPWLVSVEQARKLNGVELEQNLVDAIWADKPALQSQPAFDLPLQYAGKTSEQKIADIVAGLQADALLLTDPISINWLLNIRGNDLAYTPIKLCYAVVYKSAEIDLFEVPNHKNISISGAVSVQIDPKTCPQALLEKFSHLQISELADPCLLPKAIKNAAEIESIKQAHNIDGRALTKFLRWIKENQQQDEISAAKKLAEFRGENVEYIQPSFTTISGFGSNGAVVHYSVTKETNKNFAPNNLYLVDSGGQYLGDKACGTTDVTRAVAIGKPTAEMIHDYTLVLKGHIAVAIAEFEPSPENGTELDKLARQFLRAEGKEYDHGTGHGVGHYLSVHEGPCGISPRAKTPFAVGMLISNEPGFYKAGAYGIRIENLVLVVAKGKKLGFETLTKAPFDEDLIDYTLLTNQEKDWIKNYHEQVSKNI